MMRKKLIAIVLLGMLTALNSAVAIVHVSDSIDEPNVSKWIMPPAVWKNDDAAKTAPNELYQSRVIVFFSALSPQAEQLAVLLNDLQRMYKKDKLSIIALSPESSVILDQFIANRPHMAFALGEDGGGAWMKTILGPRPMLPWAIWVGRDNIVKWHGNVEELGSILDDGANKIFDQNAYQKAEPLFADLRIAMMGGRFKEVEKLSTAILKLLPDNISALQGRLFVYESSGELDKAWAFLTQYRQDNPQARKIFALQIDFARRNSAYRNEIPKIAGDFIRQFPQRLEDINLLIWNLLLEYNFNQSILQVAADGVAVLKQQLAENQLNPRLKWSICSTIALYYYKKADLEQAIKFQQQAVDLAGDDVESIPMKELLDFYLSLRGASPLAK